MTVTPDDIAVELGRTAPDLASTEYMQWEQWIADAIYLIRKRPGLVFDDLDTADVDYVVRQAVTAHVRRPDDATQVVIAVDDASSSRTYRSARGRVEIIDEWWALLTPTDTTTRAFSITPTGSASPHMPWCSLMLGALYCSCGADLTDYQYPLYEGGVLSGDEY
jgi:hypothetical protein